MISSKFIIMTVQFYHTAAFTSHIEDIVSENNQTINIDVCRPFVGLDVGKDTSLLFLLSKETCIYLGALKCKYSFLKNN